VKVKRFFAQRAVTATAIVVAGCLMACGCSVVSPENSEWSGNYGEVTGTVTNRSGEPLESMTLSMWGEVGISQTETCYETTTDASGTFVISGVDLGGAHAYSQTYEFYVNCTRDDRAAVDEDYTTHVGSVTVESCDDCVVSVELCAAINGPGDPGSMYE